MKSPPPTLTERKEKRYSVLSAQAEHLATIDVTWIDADEPDPRWQQARDIDDWLVAHRADDATTERAYHAQCIALWHLYVND